MPMVLIGGDMSVFNVDIEDDGTYADYLGLIRDVTVSVNVDTFEADPIARVFSQNQVAKKLVTVNAPLMSVKSGSVKVSHLDLSAFSVLGQSFASYIESGTFTVNIATGDSSGRADLFQYTQPTGKKTIEFDGVIKVPATAGAGSQALPTAFFSSTPTDLQGTLTFTINSVTTTVAMTFSNLEQQLSGGEFQRLRIRAVSNAPDSGTYPAAPTGTTTIFERALNTIARHRLQITNHASEGGQMAGNAVVTRCQLQIPESGLVLATYEWGSQGDWTYTTN